MNKDFVNPYIHQIALRSTFNVWTIVWQKIYMYICSPHKCERFPGSLFDNFCPLVQVTSNDIRMTVYYYLPIFDHYPSMICCKVFFYDCYPLCSAAGQNFVIHSPVIAHGEDFTIYSSKFIVLQCSLHSEKLWLTIICKCT